MGIYKIIFENSAVAITVSDENENIIFWNKYAENLLEMSKDDLYLKPVKSLYPSEEWKKIRSENIREKGMQHHLETKILRKSNELIDVDISLSVLKNSKGKLIGSIGVIKDISDQKKAENRLDSIMEYADDSIYLLDKNCRYIMVNNELLSRFNLSEENVLGKSFSDLHSAEEIDEFFEKFRWVFDNSKPLRSEHCKNGKWFLRTLSPIKDNITGRTTAVAVISKDITDFKNAEQKLKMSEERYRTIFESSAVAITLTDKDENIVSWNKYAENLFGMGRDDLYLRPVKSLYPVEEWKKIRSENVRQKGMQHRLETKILRKDNNLIDVDVSLSVIKNNVGEVKGSIGVIKDISERKKAERDLKKADERLRNINSELEKKVEIRTKEVKNLLKQKDEFIDQLGHDLKSPLTPIINLLPKVIRNLDNPKTMERLEIINRNARYIKNLVTDTLKLAKLNSKSVNLDIGKIKFRNLVDEVIKDNQFIFEENKIIVDNLIDDNIDIKIDELQIKEVLSNLSSNAVKFMHEGDKLTFKSSISKDFLTITVKDTGLGMTKEQIEHIFDEFYKADESRHNIESSGLGLSICKRIVEWHGGHIWANSQGIEKGSEFNFTIPFNIKNKNKNNKS